MPIIHNASIATNVWIFMNESLTDTSDRWKVEQIALSTLFSLYTVVGILGNALVLYSIMKIKSWSGLENAMMCFLTNLAISDFLLCFVTFPATAISAAANTWVLGINMCWFVGFAVSYLRIVSILFMMWIGIHRALVIKYPFRKKITRRIARALSVGVWFLATIPQLTCFAGISPIHYDRDRAVCIASMISDNMIPVMIYAFLYLVIPMGTIIVVYSLLLYIAIGAVRRTHTLTELQTKDAPCRGRMTVVHRRAFGTVFAQIGGFLLCFLPFVIFVGLSAMDENIIPTRLQVYGACSSSMSAIINPLIYMNTNKTFKRFVVTLIKCQDYHNKAHSTAFISQTFKNPSAGDARPSRISCATTFPSHAASPVATRALQNNATHVRMRSRSEVTAPRSYQTHLSPNREHSYPPNTCYNRRYLEVNTNNSRYLEPLDNNISCSVPSPRERNTKTVRLVLSKSLSDSSLSSRSRGSLAVTPTPTGSRLASRSAVSSPDSCATRRSPRPCRKRRHHSSLDVDKIVLVLNPESGDGGCCDHVTVTTCDHDNSNLNNSIIDNHDNNHDKSNLNNNHDNDDDIDLDNGNLNNRDILEQDHVILCSPRISRTLSERVNSPGSL